MCLYARLLFVYFLFTASVHTNVMRADAQATPVVHRESSPEVGQPIKAWKTGQNLVVGYSSVGSESEWRVAQTTSLKETAKELGVTLKFTNYAMLVGAQPKEVRDFIARKVDVIGVTPIVEDGWEPVLREAREAGIPIIVVDRRIDVLESLYVTFIGYNFVAEGSKACQELARVLNGKGNIVELKGTMGSEPANDRQNGFRDCLQAYPGITMIASESGNFTRAEGKQKMEAFLKTYGAQINGVFAHNDDMAIGAIQAIEEYGLKPGVDIKIVSIDGIRAAFEAIVEGKLNATVECNPLVGPLFFETALKIVNGEEVPKFIPMPIRVFRQEDAAQELPNRKY
jgi:ABC-type sugar transport system substrate-binding protein